MFNIIPQKVVGVKGFSEISVRVSALEGLPDFPCVVDFRRFEIVDVYRADQLWLAFADARRHRFEFLVWDVLYDHVAAS